MIYVFANGCPENRIDAARIRKFFLENGWALANDFRIADLIVFNSCGQQIGLVTVKKPLYSIKMLQRIIDEKKSSAEIIVSGCLVKTYKDLIKEIHKGVIINPNDFERFNTIFQPMKKIEDIHGNHLIPRQISLHKRPITNLSRFMSFSYSFKLFRRKMREATYLQIANENNVYTSSTFLIKVSTGCLCNCSFCSIHLARGRLKSKTIGCIFEEFNQGLNEGYLEFGLIGTDVGCYGRDQGNTLITLLRELLKKEGEYKIKIRNIQPKFLIEMLPELREIFKSGKISYIESSVESGNNRILNLMNRGYTIEDFKKMIHLINKEFPDIKIRTQILVGFPSETDDEFQDSLRLIDELKFDFVEIYKFRAEPNIKATKMKNQLPPKVIDKRYHRLYMKFVRKKKIEKQIHSN
jgi:MiaB/RimO family radical SAM methylthiotransferase